MNLAAAQVIKSTRSDPPSKADIVSSPRSSIDFDRKQPSSLRKPSTLSSLLSYADLMITQPPLKGMQAFLMDAKDSALHHGTSEAEYTDQQSIVIPVVHSKISCDAGITLGFVADVAEELPEKRKTSDKVEYHQDKVVVFKAIVSYCVQSDAAPRKRSKTKIVTSIE